MTVVVLACQRHSTVISPQVAAPNRKQSFCWADRNLGAHSHLIVDLRLKSGHENRRATATDSVAVLSRGGRILYAFQVAVLRAAVDTSALRALIGARTGIADMAYVVNDPNLYDVTTQIFFDRPLHVSDSLAIASLGGRVFAFRPGVKTPLNATLPDSIVSRLTKLDGVTFVRALAFECIIAGTGSEPQ